MTDELYMKYALKEAELAYTAGDVPVGAVVVAKNQIIGKGHNQIEMLKEPTAHAEMIAITAAVSSIDSKWLNEATLYVTLEPCAMCAGAIVLARIRRLVFGASDTKMGACGSLMNIVQESRLNHRVEVVAGVMEPSCSSILKEFFAQLREKEDSDPRRN